MRILTVTSLFPGGPLPANGVFVLRRVQAMRAEGAEVRVISPQPWVPPGPLPSDYRDLRAMPRAEEVQGVPVRRPRYLMLPKIGMWFQDRAYARALLPALREEAARFRPDVIDVHYLYPDACAVARVARELGIPYIVSARGSDVKRIARIPAIARRIRVALGGARGTVAMSKDLAAALRPFTDGDIRVIPNGVDATVFHPRDRAEARRALGLPVEGRRIVCVGRVDDVHGQDLLLEALRHPDAPMDIVLDIVGEGEFEAFRRRATEMGLSHRVRVMGPVPPSQVPLWFSAADASAHPGRWAGSPNAVLESLACGTRCLASDIPEMREALPSRAEGVLAPRTP
ncbi:MAG: glycosyltransferase, partial [Planctomycetes bacterium]|nr:glycosyltransferase [Planctomycetota bacterium]